MADERQKELLRIDAAASHDHAHDSPRSTMAWAQTAVLAGMAVLFTWLLVSGSISNYINTRFVGYTYIGAAALAALAIYSGFAASGKIRVAGHGLTWAAAGVVAVPLLMGIIAPSRPLGADAITAELDAGSIAAVDSSALPGNDTTTWNILDWLRSFHVLDNPASLDGRAVDVTGFVREPDEDLEGAFRITRFLVNCCVADTVSVSMLVMDDGTAGLRSGDWVQVTGIASLADINGETQLTVTPDTITRLPEAPKPPYLYP